MITLIHYKPVPKRTLTELGKLAASLLVAGVFIGAGIIIAVFG